MFVAALGRRTLLPLLVRRKSVPLWLVWERRVPLPPTGGRKGPLRSMLGRKGPVRPWHGGRVTLRSLPGQRGNTFEKFKIRTIVSRFRKENIKKNQRVRCFSKKRMQLHPHTHLES